MLRVSAVDPALANMGLARFELHPNGVGLIHPEIKLIRTDRRTTKSVRQNSDDLRRAQELTSAFHDWVRPTTFCFAEVPTGAQSARASYAFGVAVGILAGSPAPIIQVQPIETKLISVGSKTASKADIIRWAATKFPDLPWQRYEKATPKHAKGELHEDNEHVADAIAIAYAGLATDEFQRALVLGGLKAQKSLVA